MQKIADLLVRGRKAVLVLMIVLAALSAALIPRVNLVTDMSEYLPDDSSMKQGLDLMEEEFPDTVINSTIRVMFKDLSENEKEKMKSTLEKIKYVDSVGYDTESEQYNKENYTLYVLNIPYDYNTDEIESVESTVKSDFSEYDMAYHVDETQNEIPGWVIAAALLILMVILFIMSSSWVEPILFMLAIGIAVIINMGTNAFLGGVSYATDSIAAILQLILSMDYSIILMNRYRQELKQTQNRQDAMKKALTAAFSSITGSSVTTIVGLLALCFMSFKIGADLGIVLAKGVLISLISVFTVLPALILLCDKWIHKTSKRVPHIPMKKIGGFSFKARYGILGVFIAGFIVLFITKSNVAFSYSLTLENEIDKVFTKMNPVIMMYDNQDEEAVNQIAAALENQDGVESVMSYGNTLGKPYTAKELEGSLADMGIESELDISEDMLALIYYDYYKQGETGTMTLSDFMGFVKNDIMGNDAFSSYFDVESQKQIEMFAPFCSKEELAKKRSSNELSVLFGADAAALNQLFAKSGTETMSIQDLIQLISADPAIASAFASGSPESQAQMQLIQNIVMSVMQEKQYKSAELAGIFAGMSDKLNEQTMELLYTYYFSQKNADTSWTLSIEELFGHVTDNMLTNEKYKAFFSGDIESQLEEAKSALEDGKKQLIGKNHSLMMISTTLPEDSGQTTAFMEKLEKDCNTNLQNDYYLIGGSPMAYEMSKTFGDELNRITLLTAIAILLVVMFTFRSVSVPLLLVLVIQAAVYATMVIMELQGLKIYYLALLVVQSILMGATIDYAILFTSYYREKRETMEIKESLIGAYEGSIHTILTSGLILVAVTGVLGYTFPDPTCAQICHTIAVGAAAAIILVVFFLPGILAAFDRWICRKKMNEIKNS